MSDPSGSATPKAIGSLAKKQSDLTRQGSQKLKFVPTLPQRRKKEEVKQEPVAGEPSSSKPVRGRGRGRGDDTRNGARGRGAPTPVELTASGPFAMGPSQTGRSTTDRSMTHSTNALMDPSRLNTTLSQTGPPLLGGKDVRQGKEKQIKVEEGDGEVYSEPEDGVEILDMDQVKNIDWMAPDILRKKRRPKENETKLENMDVDNPGSNQWDDEELEDVIESFRINIDTEQSHEAEKLFFFQFPSPFPTFMKSNVMDVDPQHNTAEKKVTFAPDAKPDASSSRAVSTHPEANEVKAPEREPVTGKIGQLEVYRSGAVKMRLSNDILLDVTASTQPSFLQQVVHLDQAEKRLVVLGEVNKQFVVSPNVEALLASVEKVAVLQDENLMKID